MRARTIGFDRDQDMRTTLGVDKGEYKNALFNMTITPAIVIDEVKFVDETFKFNITHHISKNVKESLHYEFTLNFSNNILSLYLPPYFLPGNQQASHQSPNREYENFVDSPELLVTGVEDMIFAYGENWSIT